MTTTYKTWGAEGIDDNSKAQMDAACALPAAVGGALMPDAHLGYGLPIGGVLALENAVCPYAVGVDIACRMKISLFAIPPSDLDEHLDHYSKLLQKNTFFGVGVENKYDYQHSVLDELKDVSSPPIQENYDKACRQLGTSGSGNHFVEFGIVQACEPDGDGAPDTYVAVMSHSGSRGTGAAVCSYYTKIAKQVRPEFGDLAYLDLDSAAGAEYFAAMNAMGEYARANHDCIHRQIAKQLSIEPFNVIENHHNFAWIESHGGRDVVVHRKGATPAGFGVLGVIPGSMGTPAYIVRGLGNRDSLHSASHGAGRVMSRKQAKKTFNYRAEVDKLKAKGITVLSAGADEMVGVYKDIDQVMAAQRDLVEPVAVFHPKIVKMCQGNERAED